MVEKKDLDIKLINLVKERPSIYDTRLPKEERSKAIRDALWQEISDHLEGKFDPNIAESRWKYLRENYIRARKKEQTKEDYIKQTGLKLKNKRRKYCFRYYEIMEFLNDVLDYQKLLTTKNVAKVRNNMTSTNSEISPKTKLSTRKAVESIIMDACSEEQESEEPALLTDDYCVQKLNTFNYVEAPTTSSVSQASMESKRSNVTSPNNSEFRSKPKIDNYDKLFLDCLQKPIEKPSPIDGFLLRLGEGLKRLPYRERSKLELEFLKRLFETEEQLENNNKQK